MHAQYRVPRAAAAKLTQPTSSETILALFDHKNFLNTIDTAEAMPVGAR